jgi:hypothetical protein
MKNNALRLLVLSAFHQRSGNFERSAKAMQAASKDPSFASLTRTVRASVGEELREELPETSPRMIQEGSIEDDLFAMGLTDPMDDMLDDGMEFAAASTKSRQRAYSGDNRKGLVDFIKEKSGIARWGFSSFPGTNVRVMKARPQAMTVSQERSYASLGRAFRVLYGQPRILNANTAGGIVSEWVMKSPLDGSSYTLRLLMDTLGGSLMVFFGSSSGFKSKIQIIKSAAQSVKSGIEDEFGMGFDDNGMDEFASVDGVDDFDPSLDDDEMLMGAEDMGPDNFPSMETSTKRYARALQNAAGHKAAVDLKRQTRRR